VRGGVTAQRELAPIAATAGRARFDHEATRVDRLRLAPVRLGDDPRILKELETGDTRSGRHHQRQPGEPIFQLFRAGTSDRGTRLFAALFGIFCHRQELTLGRSSAPGMLPAIGQVQPSAGRWVEALTLFELRTSFSVAAFAHQLATGLKQCFCASGRAWLFSPSRARERDADEKTGPYSKPRMTLHG
jgi:hypothetical protein